MDSPSPPGSPDLFAGLPDFDDQALNQISPLRSRTVAESSIYSQSPIRITGIGGTQNSNYHNLHTASVQYMPGVIGHSEGGEQQGPANQQRQSFTFVDSETGKNILCNHNNIDILLNVPKPRRGRPPQSNKPEKSNEPRKQRGRPTTSFQPYAGESTHWTGPSGSNVVLQTATSGPMRQRQLTEWGPSNDSMASPPLQQPMFTNARPALTPVVTSDSSTARVEYVIPQEDPQRPIDVDDEDVQDPFGSIGRGQGLEEDEDEENSEKPSHPRRPPPPAVLDTYNSLIESLKQSTLMKAKPRQYETLGTFWVPQKNILQYAQEHRGNQNLEFTEFSAFDDPKGYSGFVPSSSWLRMMYDEYIEEHGAAMDQQAAMKDGRILAQDHSYKTTKQLMKINRESVFSATLTVTNDLGEVRILVFVATSSHSEFEDTLVKMEKNLTLYGLKQPEVIFTDNPHADKPFLQKIFPSLLQDVVPVETYPHLKPFPIPENFDIRVSNSAAAIEEPLTKITQDIDLNNETSKLVVGLDAEWNVDRTRGSTAQPTAIVQVAYSTWVNIFQIRHFNGNLPAALIAFLANPHILKAGRNVNGDLTRLAKESKAGPFSGAVELAKLAKELGVIKDARAGLAELCAEVLGLKLEKPPDLQTSGEWDYAKLSDRQKTYAAL
ncbi:hypothetical protein B0H16DRAFT_1775887 [Mycena metata]|uniref:3'-5' exonuclease n=1 Tax=Mycena metata TaxID=1033252 RepID=A0AAD7HW30_9AGAR|nr:hypothetical protein B0H16DRAFT_1775887 [Mycena metata]